MAGVESNMITVRGHELKVSIEKSQRQKTTSSNMHRAAAFLKIIWSEPRVLSTVPQEFQDSEHDDKRGLGVKLPRAPTSGFGMRRNVWNVGCH